MKGIPHLNDINEVLGLFSDVLDCPLYTRISYTGAEKMVVLPLVVAHYCERCKQDQNWQLVRGGEWWKAEGGNGFNAWKDVGLTDAEYKCKNCEQEKVTIYVQWFTQMLKDNSGRTGTILTGSPQIAVSIFMKVGQYPPLKERLPSELAAQLDSEEKDYYSKAIRCRNFGMGLAASAYMRRVVERKLYVLLDLIVELDKSLGQTTPIASEIEAIKAQRPSDILDFAGRILPKSLKPGGHNPLDGLYGVFSDGLHNQSEEDCVTIFDEAKVSFEYLFKKLRSELDDAEAYVKATEAVVKRRASAQKDKG